jgi:glyoxylase-like metal-dependent hydrolase (beta-lactamase superfamily II)
MRVLRIAVPLLTFAIALAALSEAAPLCSGVLTPEQRDEFHEKIGRPHRLSFTEAGGEVVKQLTSDEVSRLSVQGRPYLVLGRARISEEAVGLIKAWLRESAVEGVPGWNSAVGGVQPPESWFGLNGDDFMALQEGSGTAGRIKVADLAKTVSARASVGVTVHVAKSATGALKFLWAYLYQSNHNNRYVLTPLAICAVDVLTSNQSTSAQPTLFTTTQVAPNVWAAISNMDGPSGGNSGFVIGDDAVLVIDTFASADAATLLLAEIQKVTQLPVRYVVNSHFHFDHVGGNRVFSDVGAAVVAQRNVRNWIVSENFRLAPPTPDVKAMIASVVAPAVLYEQRLDLYLGSRKIEIISLPGHTGGDSVVRIPDARVIFGGDLIWRNAIPNLMDANTMAWASTLDALVKMEPMGTFIPGHGDLADALDVLAFRDYLAALRTLVADGRAKGQFGSALVEAVTAGLRPRYGSWTAFDAPGYLMKIIADVAAELAGTKRVPPQEPR